MKTTLKVVSIPILYVGIQYAINDLKLNIVYDNGFTENTTDFTIENYDCNKLGVQNITVIYKTFSTQAEVTVRQRNLWQIRYSSIPQQIYMGKGTVCEPEIVLTYSSNDEILIKNIDYTIQYLNNTTPGTATIIITGIGNYTSTRQISFSIICEHNYEVTEYTAPTCTENGYRKEICNICEDVKECYYTHVFTENLPESAHNYANNTNITYTYEAKGAEYLDLLFSSSTKLESSYDYIYIYDSTGTQIGKYTGITLASKTIRVTGDTVKIKITSDSSVTYYGFSLDSITAKYPYAELKATGHTIGDWIIDKEPTIYEEGVKQQICSVCKIVINEETIAKSIHYGDANNDGKINSLDLTNLRIALFSININYTDNTACDANGDGEIDVRDLVRLKKFLVGIDVPLGPENTETQTAELLSETAYLDTKNTVA